MIELRHPFLRPELRKWGSGIILSCNLFGFDDYTVDDFNHLYVTLLMAKTIDVTCTIQWAAYTRFMTSKIEFVAVTPEVVEPKTNQLVLYHLGEKIYSLDKDKAVSTVVWKIKSP